MPVSKDNFQASIEDADKSTIHMKYWSPKAHLSVHFCPPASKLGFPGTVSSCFPTARPPPFLTSIAAVIPGSKLHLCSSNMVGGNLLDADVIFPVIECFIEFYTIQLQMQKAANSF